MKAIEVLLTTCARVFEANTRCFFFVLEFSSFTSLISLYFVCVHGKDLKTYGVAFTVLVFYSFESSLALQMNKYI